MSESHNTIFDTESTGGALQFKDNSRLSEFKLCPRKFFFHYIKHIVPSYPRPALDFGSAWHKAMDYVWMMQAEGMKGSELATGAYKEFLKDWEERGHPLDIPLGDEKRYLPRTPGTAIEMIHSYVKIRSPWLSTLKIVEAELPFAVPIDPDNPRRFYVGRLDKVYIEGGLYVVGEHKTSSMYSIEQGFQHGFTDSFDPNSQVDGYSFALKMLYGAKTKGVCIDAALVHKTHHDIFKFIPISKAAGYANDWLEDANYWWDRVDEAEKLEHYAKHASGACRTVFGACEYKQVCLYTKDCSAFMKEEGAPAPEGYKIDNWEPFSFDELQEAVKNAKGEGGEEE